MAEQITHDVVKQAQSVGGHAPIDDPATTTSLSAGHGDVPFAAANSISNSNNSNITPVAVSNATNADADQVDGATVSVRNGEDTVMGDSTEFSDNQLNEAPTLAETKEHLVNGDAGEHSASEDLASQQALGDVSGGSDTDISRPGSVDPTKEDFGGHMRSNSSSVKKPTSFKSVSVTKNFLAKSAVSTPAARAGDKVAPTRQANTLVQQTARPRLVAKSGTGVGNLQRAGSSGFTNGAVSGPDASKVWNKNQPIPPPPPKQFTDEELKQQYGIHLATRLPADESGKEAKWADIDDDEDDWAPDTVQWMDGTKSTVAAAVEDPPAPSEEIIPAPNEPDIEAPKQIPTTVSPRPASTTGTKTILKPGAHAQPTATRPGLTAKGQSDKPTLVAKPSGSAPAKSPWATLPPVEKVPPVQINPPVQTPPARYSQQDSRGYDAFPSTSQPAKEIAPDDFNRSWRDDRGNRELFNSHSGRYEPVQETRRGSVRDHGFRQQPSVLQRPPHDGPAEPSAAFQTSRTSTDGSTWGRRRNSSNVSGESGRRMSIDRRGPDLPNIPLNVQRRGSHSINGSDGVIPGTPRLPLAQKAANSETFRSVPEQIRTQKTSPNLANVTPISPYGSVDSSGVQDVATQDSGAPVESAVEVQNRLMREKLERARLAKQKEREQEEKEEAERKERLRKKLEAMGLTDEAKPKAKEQPMAHLSEKSPLKEKALPAPVQSPPKPPVPTSEGEIAQYGMMKVHQPQPVKKAPPEISRFSARSAEMTPKPTSSPVKAPSDVQPKVTPAPTEAAPQPLSNLGQEDSTTKPQPDQSQAHLQHLEPETRNGSQGLKPSPPSQAAWSSNLPQQPRSWTSNVWGPPKAKDRALGNGTFEPSFNRGQPSATAQQLPSQTPSIQPSVIGQPAPLKPVVQTPQAATQPFAQQSLYTKKESLPSQTASLGSNHLPGPIGPPTEKPTWGNFAAVIRRDDQALVQKARQDLERFGGETYRPELRETYTDQQGKSQRTLHPRVGGNASLPNAPTNSEVVKASTVSDLKAKEDSAKSSFPATTSAVEGPSSQSHLPVPSQTGRSSRFFPRPSEANQVPATASSIFDSPPPPETEFHPAFTGDLHHPVVKMPKPPPRVRLPPSSADSVAPAEAPVTMPHRVRLGLGARPLALDPEWQARFNSLLDKSTPAGVPAGKGSSSVHPPVQPRPGSLAIAAASKAPLEVRGNRGGATVSLPSAVARKIFAEDDSSDVITRASVEDILLEEREFGSLPTVRLSKVPHLAANEPPIGFPNPRLNNRFQRPLEVTSKAVLHASDSDAETVDVIIRLASMKESIIRTVTRKRLRKTFNPKPKRNFTPANGPTGSNQNPRSRKSSGYQGQGSNAQNQSRQSSGGNGWGNNRSNQANNNNSNGAWVRRAAPVH